MEQSRLDILLYAHDGRGLGHVSRTVAIGLALRRLAPRLKVLVVTGCKLTQELIGPAPLDWLKLPSYETEVVDGKSRGVAGNSRFDDQVLGRLRTLQLRQIVELYRPRVVLADHTPQGKHRELVGALEATTKGDTRWLLGVRGVIGGVEQARSDLAANLFADHYSELYWYGDKAVLGEEHLALLRTQYRAEPQLCGYVSRFQELRHWLELPVAGKALAGTLAVPWLGEHTLGFLDQLAEALTMIGPQAGRWRLYVDAGPDRVVRERVAARFASISHCRLAPLAGVDYLQSLLSSQTALVYGGYNSVMDVLAVPLPAVVVLRGMRDSEQQHHLAKLLGATGDLLRVVEERRVEAEQLATLLAANLAREGAPGHGVDLSGGERAASRLLDLLTVSDHNST